MAEVLVRQCRSYSRAGRLTVDDAGDHRRRAWTATLGLTGRIAMLEKSEPAVVQPYFDAPVELIGGGTPEIQLTVIASMVLGLPRN